MVSEIKVDIETGETIAYKLLGDTSKPTIIFANGAIFNYRQFEPVYLPKLRKRLGEEYSFLLYDYVGYGNSSPLIGDFDFFDLVNQHKQLMDELNIEKAHLFGLSKGSLISHLFANEHPERVISIGAFGSPNPANDAARDLVNGYYERRLEEIYTLKDKFKERITEENFDEVYDKIYIPSMMERKKEDLNLIQKISVWFMKGKLKPLILGPEIGMMEKLFKGFLTEIDEEVKLDYIERMKSIDVPTLHMHGMKDPYIPYSSTELLSEIVPNSKMKLFSTYMHNRPTLIPWQGGNIMKHYANFLRYLE